MSKQLTRIATSALALMLSATPVFAGLTPETPDENVVKSNTSQNIEVTANVNESWTVTIPKEISLTGTAGGSGEYTGSIPVTVQGDIGVTKQITVETDASVELTEESSKNTVNAIVTLDNTVFKSADLRSQGTMSAIHDIKATLTPGTWSGDAEFRINIGKAT